MQSISIEKIKQIFELNNIEYKETNTGELYIKCPFCKEDYHKSKYKLYIGYNKEKESFAFICFRCGTKGYNLDYLFQALDIDKTYYENLNLPSIINEQKTDITLNIDELSKISNQLQYNELKKQLENKCFIEYNLGRMYLEKRISKNIFNLNKIIINSVNKFIDINNRKIPFGYYIIIPSLKYTKIACRRFYGNKVKHLILKLYDNDSIVNIDPFILINDYKNPELFIVEGIFDMLKLYDYGKNVLALTGKSKLQSLKYQIEFLKIHYLKELTNLIYFFDNDIINKDMNQTMNYFNTELNTYTHEDIISFN